jgi:hypothetical protein
MGFFTALGRILRATDDEMGAEHRSRLYEAWGLSDTSHPEFADGRAPVADPAEMAAPPQTTDYDRTQWERKLRTILDGLPESQEQWDRLLSEASALGFEDDWVRSRQREEFGMLIRRVVADSRMTPQEQRNIELARSLIGLSEADAEQVLGEVIAEAEAVFGRRIEGAEPVPDAPA